MSCPTCDHTMHSAGSVGAFWCPRCGTLRLEGLSINTTNKPWLVDRCRAMEDSFGVSDEGVREEWKKLAISESIYTPEERR